MEVDGGSVTYGSEAARSFFGDFGSCALSSSALFDASTSGTCRRERGGVLPLAGRAAARSRRRGAAQAARRLAQRRPGPEEQPPGGLMARDELMVL